MHSLLTSTLTASLLLLPVLARAQPGPMVTPVTDRGVTTLHVAGLTGRGSTFDAQVDAAFDALRRVLDETGARPEDVVTVRAFVVGLTAERAETVARGRANTFPIAASPAASLIGVEWLVPAATEIALEAVAVLATGDATVEIDRHLSDAGASGIVTVRAHDVATSYVWGVQGRGGGLARQSASIWEELGARLSRVGASYADLVRTTTFIVGLEPGTYWALYHDGVPPEVWHLEDQAASTFVGVPHLADASAVVAVDAVAVTAVGGRTVSRRFIEPAGLSSQAVATAGAGGATVRVGGQTGRPGTPAVDQAALAVGRLTERLEAAGGGLDDLVALTVYVASGPGDAGHVAAHVSDARRPDVGPPATTVVGIGSLYAGEAAVAVEGTAVVPR